ncbi:uncharacterized protein LOC143153064 [Ptiloglossa arizonensis]|uniref:uncharacterized protein LOC143153064 n=1 Tax=Ptiloglossa arizonensis TaxID=3350558 RepID=UPI003FA16DE4
MTEIVNAITTKETWKGSARSDTDRGRVTSRMLARRLNKTRRDETRPARLAVKRPSKQSGKQSTSQEPGSVIGSPWYTKLFDVRGETFRSNTEETSRYAGFAPRS